MKYQTGGWSARKKPPPTSPATKTNGVSGQGLLNGARGNPTDPHFTTKKLGRGREKGSYQQAAELRRKLEKSRIEAEDAGISVCIN